MSKNFKSNVYNEFDGKSGEFKELEFKNYFRFTPTSNEWALSNGLSHEIYVDPNGGVRYCKLLRTRVYIAVDENENGKPVLEKWNIKHS